VEDGVGYPGVMITTGMNDPRVVPWEPGKMATRLQRRQRAASLFYRVSIIRVATATLAEPKLLADQWSFLLWQFGISGYQPANPAPGK
jgi:prolyl oligopeptidase